MHPIRTNALCAALSLILFTSGSGCQPRSELAEAAVVLTFDDTFIEPWHDHRWLFDEHDARATFLLGRPAGIEAERFELLRQLQDEGHEMGCHTLDHVDVVEYVDSASTDALIDDQILPALEIMDREDLGHRSFSYPYGRYTGETNDALADHFDILRGIGRADDPREIFHTWRGETFVHAASVDLGTVDLDDLAVAMDMAVEDGNALLLYAHKIIETEEDYAPETPSILTGDLATVLQMATDRDLPFHTLSYLVSR
jgi:peptidoglycan-N-acetylglucosamine deacetylase